MLLCLAGGEQLAGIHAAHATCHAHAHKACHRAVGVGGCCAHRIALGAGDVGGCHGGIAHDRGLLQVLDHLLVLLRGGDGVDAKAHNLDTAQVTPVGREDLVERAGELGGVAGDGAVADAHLRNLGKGGLQGGEQLGLKLAVDLVARIAIGHVAAHVGVEQQRVGDAVRILAVAAHGDVDVQANVVIDHAEGHRRGGAVLVADDLLGVDEVDALVLARVAAKGKAAADIGEGLLDGVAQVAAKDARLAAGIEDELTGLQRDFDDLAVLHHEHALAVVDGDDRAVGDDVVLAARVGAAATGALAALAGQDVSRHRFAIDKFLPLVGHDAAGSSQSSFQESHGNLPFSSKAGWYWLDCLVVLVVFHDNGGLGVAEGVVLLGQVELAAVLVGVGGLVGRLELAYQ